MNLWEPMPEYLWRWFLERNPWMRDPPPPVVSES